MNTNKRANGSPVNGNGDALDSMVTAPRIRLSLARILRPTRPGSTFREFMGLYRIANASKDRADKKRLMADAVGMAFAVAHYGHPSERIKFLDEIKFLKLRKPDGQVLAAALGYSSPNLLRNRMIDMGEPVLTLWDGKRRTEVSNILALCGDEESRIRISKMSKRVLVGPDGSSEFTTAHIIGRKGPQEARDNVKKNPDYGHFKDLRDRKGNSIEDEIEGRPRNVTAPLTLMRRDGRSWTSPASYWINEKSAAFEYS